MLIKLILLGFAIWLILTILKQYRNSMDTSQSAEPEIQDIVRCAHCGIHVPKAESVEFEGAHYCSIEHSQKKP